MLFFKKLRSQRCSQLSGQLCGASSPVDQERINRTLAEAEPEDFAETFLHAKGLAWAAELLARWPGHAPDTEPTFPPTDMIAAE